MKNTLRRIAAPAALLVCVAGIAACGADVPASPTSPATPTVEVAAPASTTTANAGFTVQKLCDLADARIDESSGLAASRRYPGLLWTHNDSGDAARLFLVNQTGATLAEVELRGAGALDWEDMAAAGVGEDGWIYVADVGDNLEARPAVAIYRFREPEIDTKSTTEKQNGAAPKIVVDCEQMTIYYPDGPHNVETLLATSDGLLLIVTKNKGESLLFSTPDVWKKGARFKMKPLGAYSFPGPGLFERLTTGGDLSPDGTRLVIRTYTHAYEWNLTTPNALEDGWWNRAPRAMLLPQTQQGEAICYALDGKSLFLTSEKTPTPLLQLTASDVSPLQSP
ncbi:MAG TPA: hypothetical protein VF719_07030 [Abditibacteriaceae bacterium]